MGTVDLGSDKSRLPYMAQSIDATPEIESVMFIAKVTGNPAIFTVNVDATPPTNLSRIDDLKLCRGINIDIELGTLFSFSIADTDKVKGVDDGGEVYVLIK